MSRVPLFSFTFDKLFHNFKETDVINTKEDCRFSIFSFGWGARKFYFFTIKKCEFSIFKKLDLDVIVKPIEESVSNYKKQRYFRHIEDIEDPLIIQEEIDFLRYKIENENNVKSISFDKVMTFNTVALIFIPLLLNSGFKISINYKNSLTVILMGLFLYCLSNVVVWFFDYIKVKETFRSRFSELREKVDIEDTYIKILKKKSCLYYFDWINIQNEKDRGTNFVVNIERYFKLSLIIILMLICQNIIIDFLTLGGVYEKTISNKLCRGIFKFLFAK